MNIAGRPFVFSNRGEVEIPWKLFLEAANNLDVDAAFLKHLCS
ncbi:MAG: hypothetical protein ACJ0RO_01380 [Candidatus Neomarinimicrobiota bacterium]